MYCIVTVNCLKPVKGEDDVEQLKRVSEKYLVDAMTITEAEAKIKGWVPNNWHELHVKGAAFMDLDSVIRKYEDQDFYLGRVAFPEEGKKTIKWKSFQVMVDGTDLKDALNNLITAFTENSTIGYKFTKIEATKVLVMEDLVPSSK